MARSLQKIYFGFGPTVWIEERKRVTGQKLEMMLCFREKAKERERKRINICLT